MLKNVNLSLHLMKLTLHQQMRITINSILILLTLCLTNCSKSDAPEEMVVLPDYNRVHRIESAFIDSRVRYFFNEANTYTHFSTGKHFSEKYTSNDSLVIDYNNFGLTRRALKFNANNIIIYTYDNQSKFISKKNILNFNSKKIIKTIESYGRNEVDEAFLGGTTHILDHDESNNLIEIKLFEDTGNINPDFVLEHVGNISNITHFDHPFPNFALKHHSIVSLQNELFTILYNKGYRLSANGVKSHDRQFFQSGDIYNHRSRFKHVYPVEVASEIYIFNEQTQKEHLSSLFTTTIEFGAL